MGPSASSQVIYIPVMGPPATIDILYKTSGMGPSTSSVVIYNPTMGPAATIEIYIKLMTWAHLLVARNIGYGPIC
jgi:hypothetical protein